jgi:hypothetical protein
MSRFCSIDRADRRLHRTRPPLTSGAGSPNTPASVALAPAALASRSAVSLDGAEPARPRRTHGAQAPVSTYWNGRMPAASGRAGEDEVLDDLNEVAGLLRVGEVAAPLEDLQPAVWDRRVGGVRNPHRASSIEHRVRWPVDDHPPAHSLRCRSPTLAPHRQDAAPILGPSDHQPWPDPSDSFCARVPIQALGLWHESSSSADNAIGQTMPRRKELT